MSEIDRDVDALLRDAPDQEIEMDETKDAVETPCKFVTGIAGSGKTFLVRQQAEEDPKSVLLCATTGIAAVNLGTITLHSALGLHPDAIDDQFTSGYMRSRMHQIAQQYRSIGIDEMSMLSATLLDMLHTSAQQVNEFKDIKHAFGLTLIGDFCQLAPIKEPYCFTAECWPKFESNTVRLQTNWRQGNGLFLDALNLLRGGNGARASAVLEKSGAKFSRSLDPNFDGTVILGRNAEVDNYNQLRYWRLKGEEWTYSARRWGKQSGGWNNIPDVLKVKEGAYVMILANDTSRDEFGHPQFKFVNGDCGHVVEGSRVKLVRTGETVDVEYVERRVQHKHAPDEFTDDEIDAAKKGKPLSDGTFYDHKRGFWVRGAITYMPLRLAYATTVHKSQGLSLDRIMVDMRHNFLGAPAMLYVSCSRARTAEGLHLVGDPALVERRCKTDEAVKRWL